MPKQSMTPFVFPSSQGSMTQVAGLGDGTAPTPWLLGVDPSMPPNPDFNLDMLGLNINELWGDSWDFP